VPPLANLLFGKPRQALLNVLLMMAGPILGSIHALIVTVGCYQERRISSDNRMSHCRTNRRRTLLGTGQPVGRKTSRAS
jgi:hypothetical protein